MSVEEKKKEGSRAKQQVTIASRKLSSAVFREESYETLKALMLELNSVYDNFCEINEEYETFVVDSEYAEHRVVNGEDIPTYRNNVMKCYEEARKVFMQVKQTSQTLGEVQQDNSDSESDSASAQATVYTQASPVHSLSGETETSLPVGPFMAHPSWPPHQAWQDGTFSVQSTASLPTYTLPITCIPTPLLSNTPVISQPVRSTNPGISNMFTNQVVPQGHFPVNTLYSGNYMYSPNQEQAHTGANSSSSSSDIRLKKIALPTFSGERKDWPEFKAVWKQLAESTYQNKTALAHELKRCVKGEASKRIKSVYVTKPEAYEMMWKKLETYYDDTSATVQTALDDLYKRKPVAEEDYRGLVEFVDVVESSYSQLEELNQLNTLTMRDVNHVNGLLPNHLKIE